MIGQVRYNEEGDRYLSHFLTKIHLAFENKIHKYTIVIFRGGGGCLFMDCGKKPKLVKIAALKEFKRYNLFTVFLHYLV